MNYPGGIKKKETHFINYKNRGMSLEDDINASNLYYREHDIAYIYKKPTPIKISKVVFPERRKAVIKEAFFMEPSTTDYNGIYNSYYIDFEAKETKNKTSFPLSNIHPHQLKHLKDITRKGGLGFLIVRFSTLGQTFLLMEEDLLTFLSQNQKKSIPHSFFLKKGFLLKEQLSPRIDYLKIIDQILEGKNEQRKNQKKADKTK